MTIARDQMVTGLPHPCFPAEIIYNIHLVCMEVQ